MRNRDKKIKVLKQIAVEEDILKVFKVSFKCVLISDLYLCFGYCTTKQLQEIAI